MLIWLGPILDLFYRETSKRAKLRNDGCAAPLRMDTRAGKRIVHPCAVRLELIKQSMQTTVVAPSFPVNAEVRIGNRDPFPQAGALLELLCALWLVET